MTSSTRTLSAYATDVDLASRIAVADGDDGKSSQAVEDLSKGTAGAMAEARFMKAMQ